MRTEDERERGFEALLRRTLREATATSTSACVDAETLAAWSSGTLPSAQSQLVEVHLASCASCSELLAAFARAGLEPVVPAASIAPFWQRWRLRWLVPVAATATALAIWVAAPPGPDRRETQASQTALPAPSPADPQPLEERGASSPAQPAAPAASDATPRDVRRDAGAPQPSPQREAAPEADGQSRLSKADEPAAAPKAVERFGATPTPAEAETRQAETLPDAAAPPPTGAPAALPAPATADAIASFRTRANAGGRIPDVLSPDPNVRWRATADARVEVSTNGGREWSAAPIVGGAAQTEFARGLAAAFTAGASPDARTCWLVGRNGVVLLSTDRLTFRRVAFPEVVDLTAVRAVDARRASVVTADGRTFTTADGGVSWMPQ